MTLDKTKLYEPLEAIKLSQSTAKNKFDGQIEAHLVLTKTGKIGPYRTERKFPLLHTVLGKQSEKPEELRETLKRMVKTLDVHQIKKLVVCATMGPGVRVDLKSLV